MSLARTVIIIVAQKAINFIVLRYLNLVGPVAQLV